MPESFYIHQPVFINTIGHSAGALIFGYLLLLMLRDPRAPRFSLAAVAALLAVIWNAGSLVVLIATSRGAGEAPVATAVSFAALSLMPAVLLALSLGGEGRLFQRIGWIIAWAAVGLHLAEVFIDSPGLHQTALLLIAAAFGGLSIAAAMTGRSHHRTRLLSRVLAPIALLVFASSFVHFGEADVSHAWSEEIALHHAGIPLALFIVLQDYRFLLLDAFTRSLASAGLASLFLAAAVMANQRLRLLDRAMDDPLYGGFVAVAGCVALVAFASLRGGLQRWLTARVFQRSSVESAVARIISQNASGEPDLLERMALTMADHFGAERFEVQSREAVPDWAEAVARVRSADSAGDASDNAHVILLGRRAGGRRYLSEDLRDLLQLSLAATGRLERFRSEELSRLASRAELRALQAQINPHFLFNALNALYGTIPRREAEARGAVLNLAEMFRFFLRMDRPMIPVSEEVRIIRAYLSIEQLRLGPRLATEVEVDPEAESVLIPALSVQPLVENAVRHGVAKKAGSGRVSLRIRREGLSVSVEVSDTGPGFSAEPAGSEDNEIIGGGVGLDNVRQRLRLRYGGRADLHIDSSPDGATVRFSVPAEAEAAKLEVES